MDFSPDSTKIVVGTEDNPGPVCVYEVGTGRTLITIPDLKASLYVSWCRTAPLIAVSEGGGKRVSMWHAETGAAVAVIPSLGFTPRGVSFSPDGHYLAVATYNFAPARVCVWDVRSAAEAARSGGEGTLSLSSTPTHTLLAGQLGDATTDIKWHQDGLFVADYGKKRLVQVTDLYA